jgi:hypothetical protein
MTTSLPHTHIRLRDLSELVAGIPYVIGFPPTNSLVLFTFRRCPDLALSTTIRVDLPEPEHVELVATEVTAAAVLNKAVAVIAVVVAEDGPEHQELVDILRKELDDKSILLSHVSWVAKLAHGEVWQCYDNPLCSDRVPDPQSSALAAAAAVAGDTTYPDRDAVAAHLAPESAELLARREKLLDAYRMSPAQPYTDADLHTDLEILRYALNKAATSYDPPTLSDHQLVRLARALSHMPVRDECLAITLSEKPEPAERLWTMLVRALPAPERAEPAFLLAMSTYLRGSGVLAALALRIVMESNPSHHVAVLLDYALQQGLPPQELRDILRASIAKNNKERADSTPPDDDDPPWDTTPDQPIDQPDAEPSTPEPSISERSSEPDRVPEPTRETRSGGPSSNSDSSVSNNLGLTSETPGTPESALVSVPLEHLRSLTRLAGLSSDDIPASTQSSVRAASGPLSQQAATALGVIDDAPVQLTATMDALTAFLPPPTEQRGPG